MCPERPRRLVHQRDPVGEEQHPLHPVGPHQQIHQRDRGAGLAGAGSHGQQAGAAPACQRLDHRPHRTLLVRPAGNVGVDRQAARVVLQLAPGNGQRQLIGRVEALHLARRRPQVVPQPGAVAVAVVDQRPLPGHLLQAVCIQLALLPAHVGVAEAALGLHHRQRLAIAAVKHVVGEPLAGPVGHADQRHFDRRIAAHVPPGLAQQHIDEMAAGFGLAVIVPVGHRNVRSLGLSQLGAAGGQFGIHLGQQRLALGQGGGLLGQPRFALLQRGMQLADLVPELRLLLLQLVTGEGHGLVGAHQGGHQLLVPLGHDALGIAGSGVGARQPEQHVEQLAHQAHGVAAAHALVAVHGQVAELLDQPHLVVHVGRHQLRERHLGEQHVQPVFVWHAQVAVVPVQPVHRLLQRMARAHAAGARVGVDQLLGPAGGLEQRLELRAQELEVAHRTPCSATNRCYTRTRCINGSKRYIAGRRPAGSRTTCSRPSCSSTRLKRAAVCCGIPALRVKRLLLNTGWVNT